ncbi:MAG: DUF6569 family protein [Verrucomicrobiae bacterium]|nr:DUF6569 family protein [Verrucomicrobiae bacterium]
MSPQNYRISGPYTHENLTLFLIHGSDASDTAHYVTLKNALADGKVVVHETGSVGELLIENLLEDKDIYIQAGEILRGGRQDRTIGVDVVVPAKTKIPFPTFCVERGRWGQRPGEAVHWFSSSEHYLASKRLKLATKLYMSQPLVWQEVARTQDKLSHSTGGSVHSTRSPSSLELTMEHEKIVRRLEDYTQKFQSLVAEHPDAVGFAFAINGRLNSAEIYASHLLFANLWPKLIKSAAVEAVAEGVTQATKSVPTEGEVRTMLSDAGNASAESRHVTDRITLRTRRTPKTILFDTEDSALPATPLHRHLIWNPDE